MSNTLSSKIYKIISSKKNGTVFSYVDFKSINANKKTIEQNLLRLKEKHVIETVAQSRGLYYKPKNNPLIGKLPPSEENIIKAYEKKLGTHFYISGAKASNLLGLSTQVPVKSVYYTDKQLKTLKIGNREIIFKRKKIYYNKKPSSTVFILSAIEYLGKNESYNNKTKIRVCNIIKKENNLKEIKKLVPKYHKWIKTYIAEIETTIE